MDEIWKRRIEGIEEKETSASSRTKTKTMTGKRIKNQEVEQDQKMTRR